MSVDLSVFGGVSPAHNDFRSDTLTTPTLETVQAISNSTLGDAVYEEDDKTHELEQYVAILLNKPKGLFCVSGTMSNQIAVRTHLKQPPHSVLCDYRGHIFVNEAGGLATLSQAMVQPIHPKNGKYMTLVDDIEPNFIPDDGEIHGAPTKVIALENTLHGMVYPIEEIKRISVFCKENDVKLHLDGARLWDALVHDELPLLEYGQYFDSISICLSKGIGAPIGSILVGDEKYITKANHFRKQQGGGVRQSGILAAMALAAIKGNFPKFAQVHQYTKEVADVCDLLDIPLEHPPQTNFIFIDPSKNIAKLVEILTAAGLKVNSGRLAFHHQITRESVDKIIQVLKEWWLKHNKESGSGTYYK
ncbi:Threonine aldolase [Scheffersomyces spartinae]|uniref:low-specificity L-threonine aldolase n=1 Tax=Scheffersomyces spartinae TaxID=45513 RepID=A0A9P8AJX7_9ASCO|nr:Threonine aldolase [Scheffersomyces spartinae]KAG7195885.1 Threonine aldolase [Scheffersomyces spartinae]